MELVDANLGEQRCPDGLNALDLCGTDEGLELVGLAKLAVCADGLQQSDPYSDFDTVIREDEGRVRRGEFGGGHCDR
jgi:hypothetical protein